MKSLISFVPFLILLLLGHHHSYSQNLLANGSFEDENLCTEYSKYCAPEAWTATNGSASYFFRELTKAYEGYHYVGLTAGSVSKQNARNFIRSRLLCGLRKNHKYVIEFYVCATSNVLDSIGVYFSEQDFLYEKRHFKSLQPVYYFKRPASGEYTKWQKASFVYTATGTEGYIVIGLFKRTDFKGITKTDMQDDYYFFLDKVSLSPIDPDESICKQAETERQELYKMNDRHELIDKKIAAFQKQPTPRDPLPLTKMPQTLHVDTLIVPDIFFVSGSYELNQKSFATLDSFARKIKGVLDSIVVKGHTDSVGMLDYNRELSLNRAIAVKQYIVPKINVLGVPVMARGYNFSQPVASNKTQSGRKKNRRVEIFVYRRD
jgi:outer membrane protein OmpA-like peptidoglycan-associated protein